MKHLLLFIFFCSFSWYYSQTITITGMDENKKSEVLLSDNTKIDVWFDYNTFDITNKEFKFKDREIFAQTKIGDYGIDEINLNNKFKLKYKFKRKENKVFALDSENNIAFETNLKFNTANKSLLEGFEIVKNNSNSTLVESWIVLATLNKLYESQKKVALRMMLESAVFGGAVGVVHGVTK